MRKHRNTKPQKVNYIQGPRKLWRIIIRELPKEKKQKGTGRPLMPHRNVIDGLWYIMWTCCQWKAVKCEWFCVSSSVLHELFQAWQEDGRWARIMKRSARFYARERRTAWEWQSMDSKSVPAPLGGEETG